MKSPRRLALLFWLINAAHLQMATSALLMPLPQYIGSRGATVLIGLLFWLSLIVGGVLVYFAERERMRITGRAPLRRGNLPGVVTFFANPLAALCDTVLIASAAAFVVINLSELRYQYVSYIFLFLLLFSLSMHCMLNGRIYKTLTQKAEGEKNDV